MGSSRMPKSARKPRMEPPTPAASTSPPFDVAQRETAVLSWESLEEGNTFAWTLLSTVFRTLRLQRSLKSLVWVARITFFSGKRPMKAAGSAWEVYVDLAE